MIKPIDYLKLGIEHGLYKKRDWLISILTESFGDPKYTYGLRSTMEGEMSYLNPEGEYVTIEGNYKDRPLFTKGQAVTWEPGDIPTIRKTTKTTVYETIINFTIFYYAFGDKWEFMPGRLDFGHIEQHYIVPRLVDNPGPDDPPVGDDKITVDEYLKLSESIGFMRDFVSFMTPAASPKTMVMSDHIIAHRDKRLKEDPDIINDLNKFAQLEKELTDMDREEMMNDSSAGFFVDVNKTINVARKKLHLMIGHDTGFGDTGEGESTIATSLAEGIKVKDLPALNNGMRSGSYARGKETELGGEGVKMMNQVFQNTAVIEDDCGSKVGLEWNINDDTIPMILGHYTMDTKPTPVTEELLKSKIGEVITLRSPMGCLSEAPSHCRVCIGERYGSNPQGLTSAAASVLSNIMSIFMAAFHAKELKLSKLDLDLALS